MYSKELDLDEGKHFPNSQIFKDEVPIILHELNDSAIHFISRDQYDRALQLLQKAQTLIDRLQFQRNPNDRFITLLTMHNMALCFQKLGALEECALCLEASIQSINSPFLLPKFQGDPSRKLKKLKYECKAHMQICALQSQLHRHKEALIHAEKSVMIAQYMINDLLSMCQHYYGKVITAKKNEQIAQELMMAVDQNDPQYNQQMNKDLIYYDDSVSMLERTAYRIYPIIQEVASRMIKQSSSDDHQHPQLPDLSDGLKQKLNMKAVLGYLNQSEWLYLLNIGNIMQITPLTVHDLYSSSTFDVELTRDSILEKISFLAVSYFCMSTELRFLVQVKDDPNIDPARKKKESEFWHAKALEVSCSFLPSECPLVSHILTSYQKHHAPVQQEIPEDQETAFNLKVIRPLPGIDICKFQPMVRQDESLNITIPCLPLSPNNYANKKQQQTNHLLSLPFSPNNQATTNASQNGLFSSQMAGKVQTTGSSSSNLVSSQRQGSQNQNRFNKNRNQRSRSGLGKKTHDSQDHIIDSDQQILEGSQDDHEESMIVDGNQSMMEVVPSANYKKLLNDLSQIQGSSDIIEEDEDEEGAPRPSDQFFELDEDTSGGISGHMRHQESQEIELIGDNRRRDRRRQANTAGHMVRQTYNGHNESSGQILDVSKDVLEDEDEEYGDEDDQDQLDNIKERSFQIRPKSKAKQQHNLSVDGQRMKRPQTSQGLRKSNKMMRQQMQVQNNTVRTQQQNGPQNLQDLKMIKTTSALNIVPSADGISPHNQPRMINGSRTQHNQSMATTQGKISKTGFNISQQQLASGMQTDVRGNSTPVRSQSKHKSGTFTRDQHRTGQSSTGELMNGSGKRTKSGKRQRNHESVAQTVPVQQALQLNSQSKRATQTQMNFNSVSGGKHSGQRSQSQQKKYLTNSGTKSKHMTQDGLVKQPSHHNHSFLIIDQNQQQQAITDIFMAERLIKKRGGNANHTQEQPSKTFEIAEQDSKYSSQLLSGGKSKARTKNANSSSRSKDKMHSKTQEMALMNPQNIEELKRQILMKQALLDSGSGGNARRKSTGSTALNSHSVSQTQLHLGSQLQQQRKRIDNANGSVGTTSATQFQQQMLIQGINAQAQHNQSQQMLVQQQQQQLQTQGKLKLNTHQLIKKFLNDRQSTQQSQTNLNNSVVESYVGGPDLTAYKSQLSKKIMQQQQKLLGQQAQQQNPQPRRKKDQQYITEPHPKRSATPMLEMNEMPSRTYSKEQQNSFGNYVIQNKGGMPMGDIGNFQALGGGLNSFMKEYITNVQMAQNESMREDSFAKSLKKKKQSKKATPKNVLANSQFSWL